MDDVLRVYSLTLCLLIIAAGTAQMRRWLTYAPQERLHWLSTALLNLAALVGTWEALRAGYPGGLRVHLTALALTWLLAAVLYRPVCAARARRRTHKEIP